MDIKPLGDSALLVIAGEKCDPALAARVVKWAGLLTDARIAGVVEIVPAFASLAVYYDPLDVAGRPGVSAFARVKSWVETILAGRVRTARGVVGKRVEVPVVYGGEHGPDLAKVAKAAGLDPDGLVAAHSKPVYRVAAVGFAPGFPYLLGLPEALHTPRRSTPRPRVPAGSVGIGGAQTGIYPAESPGGWQVIGRTPLNLFSPTAEPPALLAPGDEVVFKPVASWPASAGVAGVVPALVPSRGRARSRVGRLRVLKAGGLTTVQDLGRAGWRRFGVTAGGALDRLSARVANLLVGNADTAAVLEFTHTGPVLRFESPVRLALTGAQVAGLPWNRVFTVAAGAELDCSRLTGGARACLAVAGGFDAPVVLGGRGVALRGKFGGADGSVGRPLEAEDELTWGRLAGTGLPEGGWSAGARTAGPDREGVTLRVLPGAQADWFAPEEVAAFTAADYRITPRGDRMGVRLSGRSLTVRHAGDMVSQPVAAGAVQVPPDGQPIVLLRDCQTIGGYPQIAQVISADIDRLAQARPGVTVRFTPVTLAEAEQALWRQEEELRWLRAGLALRAREGRV
ncbi:MAG: 5-oxoprolinase subunit PxpB [Verrucomicrobiota bacterium]